MGQTMGKKYKTSLTRRQALAAVGATGLAGFAGCTSGGGGGGGGDVPEPSTEVRSEQEGIEVWGNELNRHAREDSNTDFKQFEGENIEINFLMGLHKYSDTTSKVKSYFEDLTGITVNYNVVEEDNYWKRIRTAMRNQEQYAGYMIGNWPAAEYHEPGWAVDLNKFIENDRLTDKDWLALDDYMEQTKEFMTFPDEGGGESFIAIPNGIEIYGCVGCNRETFEQVEDVPNDPTEMQTFADLERNARLIAESDATDKQGMVSRAASATLSAANFGTMFRSHDAKWIDREVLLNEDDPDPEDVALVNSENGVEALERFAGILYNYGIPEASRQDWYGNNATYSRGDVGMIYSTPQTSGLIDTEMIKKTTWVPPLQTEDGRDRVGDTWVWSTGISSHVSEKKQEAAWLYIQWANSRAANFLLSTHQWEGDQPRAGHARYKWIFDQDMYEYPRIEGHEGYRNTFREAWDLESGEYLVPTSPPPIPADTPENMNIMSAVANAMSRTVANGPDRAQTELDAIVGEVSDAAKRIPDRYIEPHV